MQTPAHDPPGPPVPSPVHKDAQPPSASVDRRFFGHPLALATPAATEVWERFSFYGMRAILLIYLITAVSEGGMGMAQSTALSLTAIYSAGAYLMSVGGGWVADRFLGARTAVLLGGLIIMGGHIVLAVPTRTLFYPGLVLVIVGTGLLKPNVASLVGDVYPAEDQRRDAGFNIFYMAINIGAFVAPLVCGWLGQRISYHAGFAAAACGMAIGLTYFLATRKTIAHLGVRRTDPTRKAREALPKRQVTLAAAVLLVLVGIAVTLSGSAVDGLVRAVSLLTFVVPAVWITAMYRSPRCTAAERSRLLAYIPLFVCSTLFWMLFEQSSTVLSELASTQVSHTLFGLDFPSSWLLAVNPLAVIALAPVAAWIWMRHAQRGPGTPWKMGSGVLLAGASFAVLPVALAVTPAGGAISPLWLIVVYLVQTVGELLLSPVGLAATTRLAPQAFSNQTMGVWYLSMAAGAGLGAQVVKLYGHLSPTAYFLLLTVAGLVCGGLLMLGRHAITARMAGVR